MKDENKVKNAKKVLTEAKSVKSVPKLNDSENIEEDTSSQHEAAKDEI